METRRETDMFLECFTFPATFDINIAGKRGITKSDEVTHPFNATDM